MRWRFGHLWAPKLTFWTCRLMEIFFLRHSTTLQQHPDNSAIEWNHCCSVRHRTRHDRATWLLRPQSERSNSHIWTYRLRNDLNYVRWSLKTRIYRYRNDWREMYFTSKYISFIFLIFLGTGDRVRWQALKAGEARPGISWPVWQITEKKQYRVG